MEREQERIKLIEKEWEKKWGGRERKSHADRPPDRLNQTWPNWDNNTKDSERQSWERYLMTITHVKPGLRLWCFNSSQ